jgi:hypothetical protein
MASGNLWGEKLHQMENPWNQWQECGMKWPSQQMGNASETHANLKDELQTYNCVIPYGEWDGGDLILWPI